MINANNNDDFQSVAQPWDLETLYDDLASAKGKHLTPIEKLHLRGLLEGHSPSEIADKLGKNVRGLETDLCATIYKYVKYFLEKNNEKLENWRKIAEWLEESGYKYQYPQIPVNQLLTDKSIVNITNINIESNHIVFQFNLTIPTLEVSDTERNFTIDNDNRKN